jgi:hypothetical protein
MAYRLSHAYALAACVAASCSLPAYALEELRDPMRPPGAANGVSDLADVPSAPVLQSTIIGIDRRDALISGRRVGVGDSVEGARITRIEEGRVTLRGPDGTRELRLYPEVNKKPSGAARPSGSVPRTRGEEAR